MCIDMGHARVIPLAPPHVLRSLAEVPSYPIDLIPASTVAPREPFRPERPSRPTHVRSEQRPARPRASSSRSLPARASNVRSSPPSSPPQPPDRSTALRSHPTTDFSVARGARHQRPRGDESLRVPVSSPGASLDPSWPPSRPGLPSITMERGRSTTQRNRRNSGDSFVSAVSAGPFDPRSISPDDFGRRASHYRPRR
ncbi:hypothetical protein DHEL01_v202905 [Diaporthe helianthi]|uniref:Uncharacterized protein n=1 Tax=Diaporthe helianthi TaxID=158607 RepID=A0A2P5I8A3_DIAHE|nr:hypothetical protein DHEL01_v202905 [Diaporthe helianthi]